MTEGTTLDKKSLRILALDPDDWDYKEIAKDCVAFANARGGVIYFGIEDSAEEPPAGQKNTGTSLRSHRKRHAPSHDKRRSVGGGCAPNWWTFFRALTGSSICPCANASRLA